ncbi:MAG: lamin tail domain-containing protein, partial [Bacteroidota bacterium]
MIKFYAFWGTLTLGVLFGTCVRAQDIVAIQDFEGTPTNEWFYDLIPNEYNVSNDVWGIVSSVGSISTASSGNSLWGMRDLDNPNGGGDFPHSLIFDGAISVAGMTNVEVSFDYNVVGYDSGDKLSYWTVFDGTSGDEVILIEGGTGGVSSNGWQTVRIVVPDNVNEVGIDIFAEQDGGSDFAGVDNFMVTANNPTDPCGITAFGPAEVICITESGSASTDLFRISIPYSGVDADASLLIEAGATTPANDVTATTNNIGDDPTTVANGTIILENTAGEFEEGDEVRVTLSDGGGDCNFVEDISTTDNQCNNPCDPNINPNNIVIICGTTTSGSDMGQAIIPFTNGPEPDAVVTVNPPVTISGDDITMDDDGDIILDGITEGTTYTLTIEGGGCVGTEVINVMVDFGQGTCAESDLVINEVNYDPFISGGSADLTRDPNQDGVSNGTTDEFIEFYNTGTGVLDISGYTFEDNAGVFFTAPAGTNIDPANGFAIFALPPTVNIGCTTFGSSRTVGGGIPAIGLNNGGDFILVKDATGATVAAFSYDDSEPDDQSLARNPDFV